MGGSSSQGTSSSQNSSASQSSSYLPSYSEEPILENLAQYTGQLGSDVSNWANGVWGKVANLSDQAINSYGNIAQNASNQAAGYETEANKGLDQYNNLVQDANTYNSTARQNFEAGKAEAAQTQAGQQAMNAHKQDLASYGIDPSAGRYANLDEASRLGTAAAAAGAGTQAIQNTAATGRQLRNDAIQQGQAYGNQASTQQNTALQGVAGASNTNLATANTGTNLQQAAHPYLSTAMSLKYPPLGNQSSSASQGTSQSQNTSDSVTDPPSSGNNGGNKSPGNNSSPGQQTGGMRSGPTQPGGGNNGGYGGYNGGYQPFDTGGFSGGPSDFGTYGANSWYEPSLGGYGSMGDANNYTSSGGFGGYSQGTDWSTNGSYGTGSGTINGGAGGANYSPDTSGWGASAGTGSYTSGGFYAKGGLVGQHQVPQQQRQVSNPFNFKGGGNVTPGMSPSQGNTVDDVNANLNAGEFVIPRDVVQHKGHEFFQKLISQSRQNNMNYAAQQKMRGQR